MKIYRIDVKPEFRPDHQSFIWPPQNRRGAGDRGVENDFDEWLLAHPDLLCDQPADADWCYAPGYWNRYFINTLDSDGHWGGGVDALAEEVHRCRQFGDRVFTISEADERVLHPQVDWGDMTIFCASRRQASKDIDIPLLAAPHIVPKNLPEKKYLACFLGNLQTDGIRMQMREALEHRTDCRIEHANYGDDYYAMVMLESYIALAPRGQGAASFRFYEAMNLSVVPLYISDLDCRPFSKFIDWDICSLYAKDTASLDEVLDLHDERGLLGLGKASKFTYDNYLGYSKWEKYAIKELSLL
jgi:hypothetical protein